MMNREKITLIVIILLVSLISTFICGNLVGKKRGIPFVGEGIEWSIGIYMGESPISLFPAKDVSNPVLTAKDVTDVRADFVADPFMVNENSTWYMFFEVWNSGSGKGEIGLAASSDGLRWAYKQIVLDEPFHLSYPYVFKHKGDYYMIPESTEAYSIRLYKAVNFPTKWSFVRILLYGKYGDPSILFYNGKCWLFAQDNPKGNDILRLYYADSLMGTWKEHPQSPIVVRNPRIARPGGRMLIFNNRIYRFAQDDYPYYGNQVRSFEVTELTASSYREDELAESPILKANRTGWNAKGMHHIDAHQIDGGKWIACVDGQKKVLFFGFKY